MSLSRNIVDKYMEMNLETIFVLLEELTNEKVEELAALCKSLARMQERGAEPKRIGKVEQKIKDIWLLLKPIHPILHEQYPVIVEEVKQLCLF